MKSRWPYICGCIATLVIFVWLVRYHQRDIKADYHYKRLAMYEGASLWRELIEEGRWVHHYNPGRAKIFSYLGRAYIELGRNVEGIGALQMAIKTSPNNMNALLNLGVAYGNLGKWDKALGYYEKVILIKPDWAKVHNNIANIYLRQGKPHEALKELKIAIKLEPRNAILYYTAGNIEMHLGRYGEAAHAYEDALAFGISTVIAPMLHKSLGALYLQFLNRRADGIAHLKQAVELDPNIDNADNIRIIINAFEKGAV